MLQRIFAAIIAVVVMVLFVGADVARGQEAILDAPVPAIIPATATVFGLYQGSDFRLTPGDCKACATPKQALWYFRDDLVAVPEAGIKVADFSRGVMAQEDVKRWYAGATTEAQQARPPMLWIGSPSLVEGVTLAEGGDAIQFSDGKSMPFRVAPKIKTNLSFYDGSSKVFFQQRPVRLRGEMQQDAFVARTLWPQDWVINETQMTLQPLQSGESLLGLVRQHANGKDERFETRLLWEKSANPKRDWSGRAVMSIMLNGAQGDDDEAHGGHFAIATGRHASANCAGISMDTLRTLGWNIPMAGPTSTMKAIAAYPYKSIAEGSFASGKQAYDYMIEEQSRLYPAAAYDAAGRDLLRIAGVLNSAGGSVAAGKLENLLREDIEAIVFVRIPQLPSSRAFGSFPVDARPFPPELIEPDTLSDKQTRPWAPAAGGLVLVAGLLSIRSVRKRRQ